MKTNTAVKYPPVRTHGGALTSRITPKQELERSVLACLLWEDNFYESGESIADRILSTVPLVKAADVAALAINARVGYRLRHVSMLLAVGMAKAGHAGLEDVVRSIVQRADELTELPALYWHVNGKDKPLPAAMKRGLAAAFRKFDAYQLAKYDRKNEVKLRDVLRLVHPKPMDDAQSAMWKSLIDGTLPSPDTWEVALSGGTDKKEAFTRLLRENKLGYMALLRNLRNMDEAGVERDIVRDAILARRGADKVLPFRFFTAAKQAPMFEGDLDTAMQAGLDNLPKLAGKTILVLDVSGSMLAGLSNKSTLNRLDGGAALCSVIRGQCEDVAVYATAGNDYNRVHKTELLPPRRGMALVDTFREAYQKLGGGGIFLNQVSKFILDKEKTADRVIVVTDEADCAISKEDSPAMAAPFGTTGNYILNVASYKNGIGYGKWTHITGFSEAVVQYMLEAEKTQ